MKIHILGICGTFMGSLAILAAKSNIEVSGQDLNVYPPMSTQLQEQGITIINGYEVSDLPVADIYVVGNVMRRGLPIVEYLLEKRMTIMSGPEFLAKYILHDKHVLVVTGTHGKTTTSSLLAWILHYAGFEPGYLIGGVPKNFGVSAAIGGGKYFVVEGDEYDCAFFDKRSKFIHYKPDTLIINNIEFDHADIFKDLEAILTQFHHLLRTIPGDGFIVYRNDDTNIATLISRGCWSKTDGFGPNEELPELPPGFLGLHNKLNALAALKAAANVGVPIETALSAIAEFSGVKRRLELKGKVNDIFVYSDFAHHPTAIQLTLQSMREKVGANKKIIAVVDICSNTMQKGVHKESLSQSVVDADVVFMHHAKELSWDPVITWQNTNKEGGVFSDQDKLLSSIIPHIDDNTLVLLMSNGSFEGFSIKLLEHLQDVRVNVN